jgi:hypothetical protein
MLQSNPLLQTCTLSNFKTQRKETRAWGDTDKSTSLPPKQNLGAVLRILESAEELVLADDFLLEPTPIGPFGVQSLVKEVSVTENTWHRDETFVKVLHPLLEVSEGATPQCCGSEPAAKKQRLLGTSNLNGDEIGSLGLEHFNDSFHRTRTRFRSYQSDQWQERFQDLKDFRSQHGHCLVPHKFAVNRPLAQWVKRQRYQYKLKQMNRHSTVTDARQALLEQLGFVWDSHKAAWEERFQSLCDFKRQHGHCNVSSNFTDQTLAIWIKCQRRQFKFYIRGERSTITKERVQHLEVLGFDWNPRGL